MLQVEVAPRFPQSITVAGGLSGEDPITPAKGNTNALKHGLYAQRFRAEEIKHLRKMDPADYRAEIALLRVNIDRICDLLERTENVDQKATLWGALTAAITSLNTTARTHALLQGTDPTIYEAIEAALRQYRTEEGI